VELDNIRQQNVILQKGSSSSIGATNHSPLVDNGELLLAVNEFQSERAYHVVFLEKEPIFSTN
jgi:hypothetical protein